MKRSPSDVAGLILLLLVPVSSACEPAATTTEEGIIDGQRILRSYEWRENLDDVWFLENIPLLEVPDDTLQEIWYYRWEMMSRHLTYGSPETGYMFTEFIDRPFWSGTYGGIACPLGHQMAEIRWMRDDRVIHDFSAYWLETPGALPRNYSNWYGHVAWQTFEATGNESYLQRVFPLMEAQFAGWVDERFDAEHGLFAWNGLKDGMEVNINSRLTVNEQDGAEGYRPTLNSYMIADARALSLAAARLGRPEKAAAYARTSEGLRKRMIEELWDPDRTFFFHQFAHDERGGIEKGSLTYETGPYAGDSHGRELLGYVPWQFSIPGPDHTRAWRYLMDPAYFHAPYGPTTVEQGDPQFLVAERCCVWSGNSWPFATSQTLVALANLLNGYEQSVVDAADYRKLLRIYLRSHYREGRPYIAEALDPYTGSWDGHDLPGHSEHYFHSVFIDPVVTGLLGVRPATGDTLRINPLVPDDWDWFALDRLPYHGYEVSIVWDRLGGRYGLGAGFHVLLDGERIGGADEVGPLKIVLPPPRQNPAPADRKNVAVNNGTPWPHVSASWSYPETPPGFAVDGGIWYDASPPNRWTSAGSPNEEDWIRVDFGRKQMIEEVALYFPSDSTGVVPPRAFRIEALAGDAWVPPRVTDRTPARPTGRKRNSVRFEPLRTRAIRATFEHAEGGRTGLAEIETWTVEGADVDLPESGSPNLAFNDGRSDFPRANASIDSDAAANLVDGIFGMTTYQGSRWTTSGSTADSDWVEIDLGRAVHVGRVDVYLWGRPPRYLSESDDRFREPLALRVELRRDGEWAGVSDAEHYPVSPMPMARNVIRFSPQTAHAVRVHFVHNRPGASAATEIQVFGPESDVDAR